MSQTTNDVLRHCHNCSRINIFWVEWFLQENAASNRSNGLLADHHNGFEPKIEGSVSTKLEQYFSLLLRRHLLGLWKWKLKPRSKGAHQPRTRWLRRHFVAPQNPLSLCVRKPSEKWQIQPTPWSASLHQLVQLQKGWRCRPGVGKICLKSRSGLSALN